MALITKDGDQAEKVFDAPKIEFPCENYVIKIVSLDIDGSHAQIVECMATHAPEGLVGLTSQKYIVLGDGHTRDN